MSTSSAESRPALSRRGVTKLLVATLVGSLALPPALLAAQSPAEERTAGEEPGSACLSEDFDPLACAESIARLEELAKRSPRRDGVRLALARSYWNAAVATGGDEAAGAGLDPEEIRRRSLEIFRLLGESAPVAIRSEALFEASARIGDGEERTRLLHRVVELDPRNARAFRDLGIVLLEQGRPDEGVAAYRKAVRLDPEPTREDALTHLRFAQGLTEAGRLDDAVDVYRSILRPRAEVSRTERCLSLQPLDLGAFRPFDRFVNEVEELRPYCNDLDHRDRAVEREREGRTDEAIDELEEQLRVNPVYDETYFLLERLYRGRGDRERAGDVLRRYFEREKDAAERCRRFRMLSLAAWGTLSPETVGRLGRECEVPLPKKADEASSGGGKGKWGWIAAAAVAAAAVAVLAKGGDTEKTDQITGQLTSRRPSASHPVGPFKDGACQAQVTWTGRGVVDLAVTQAGRPGNLAETRAGRKQGPPLRLEWPCRQGASYALGLRLRSEDTVARSVATGITVDYRITLVHPAAP